MFTYMLHLEDGSDVGRATYPQQAFDAVQHPSFHGEVAELHQDYVEHGEARCPPPVVLLHSSEETGAVVGQPL